MVFVTCAMGQWTKTPPGAHDGLRRLERRLTSKQGFSGRWSCLSRVNGLASRCSLSQEAMVLSQSFGAYRASFATGDCIQFHWKKFLPVVLTVRSVQASEQAVMSRMIHSVDVAEDEDAKSKEFPPRPRKRVPLVVGF